MRVKLIQRDKVVDSADCLQRVNFSVLSRCDAWKVVVDFGDGDETDARVDWSDGSGYVISTYGEPWQDIVDRHSHIVPTVRCRLLRLFQQGLLPCRFVVVTPVLA